MKEERNIYQISVTEDELSNILHFINLRGMSISKIFQLEGRDKELVEAILKIIDNSKQR